MIERQVVSGRQATVAYLSEAFEPADKQGAALVKVLFDDGEMLVLSRQVVEKHTPGGHEHDQDTHGRERGAARAAGATVQRVGEGDSNQLSAPEPGKVVKAWDESVHPRGKTTEGTTPGSFAPAGGGLPTVEYSPEHTSPDVQARFEKLMEVVPREVLAEAGIKRWYIGDGSEGIGQALEDHLNAVGQGHLVEDASYAAGAFERSERALFAPLWGPGALEEDGEVLYHEIGHALEGRINSRRWRDVYEVEHSSTSPRWVDHPHMALDEDEAFAESFSEYQLAKRDPVLREDIKYVRPETFQLFEDWGF